MTPIAGLPVGGVLLNTTIIGFDLAAALAATLAAGGLAGLIIVLASDAIHKPGLGLAIDAGGGGHNDRLPGISLVWLPVR